MSGRNPEGAGGPAVIGRDQEARFLAPWVLDALAGKRERWDGEWEFGVGGALFTAWRKDGTGHVLQAEDPPDLRRLVAEDASTRSRPPRGNPLGGAL